VAVEEGSRCWCGVALLRQHPPRYRSPNLVTDNVSMDLAARRSNHQTASARLGSNAVGRLDHRAGIQHETRKGNEGYNHVPLRYEDLVNGAAGSIPRRSPALPCKRGLYLAGLFATTECLITEVPVEEKPSPGGGVTARLHGAWTTIR